MSHMNDSCHVRMRQVSYGWVMSHVYVSCHHVSYEGLMSCLVLSAAGRVVSCGCSMSHIYASCHIHLHRVSCRWDMPHIRGVFCHVSWLRHVTHVCIVSHIDESLHTSMTWRVVSRVADASCHVYLHTASTHTNHVTYVCVASPLWYWALRDVSYHVTASCHIYMNNALMHTNHATYVCVLSPPRLFCRI